MGMNTKQTLQRIADAAADMAWTKLGKLYSMGERPTIMMNGRLKTTAGRAWLEANKIDLSVSLMTDFPREFIMQTIPHELAHIVAYQVFGYGLKRGESHGEPWKRVMIDMGLQPAIYHDMILYRTLKQEARK